MALTTIALVILVFGLQVRERGLRRRIEALEKHF